MATKTRKGPQNPVSEDDPRFDPESNAENAAAHGEPDPKERERSQTAEDIQATVKRALERAVRHYEENLEPDQKDATDYYYGRPFGDEEDGRSKVVSTDVRDATRAQMPSLLRIFFGPEKAVEFRPKGLEDEAQAAQATDMVNYVIREDNPGFLIFQNIFKDALVRRTGWVKWWWDETYRVEAASYTGLDEMGLRALQAAKGVESVEVTAIAQEEDGSTTYSATVTRKHTEGCPRFAAIPPEEVVYTPNARTLEDAPLVAHVREVPREELIQLGIDPDLIDEAAEKKRETGDELEDARQFHGGDEWDRGIEDGLDPSQKKVLFAEAYMLVDGDGDDVAELRLFQCVGQDFVIANGDGMGEVVDEVPLAIFTPDPEPHTLVGLSNYDLLKDVQRVKSQVTREMLNSLALAVDPVTEVVEGEVNMQDFLNPEVSGVRRVRKMGMTREVVHTFVGNETLAVLAHYDHVKEERTGVTKASQGLDPDSLQSSTKAAVAGTLAAAQQQIEMIARVFAETGMKRLMKGLLRLLVKHQNKPRIVRLRGRFVEIDPRHWDATMDVSVNVALGQGTPEDRINALREIVATQKELMAAGAPIVGFAELRNALAKAVEMAGFSNPDQFFRPWGPEQDAAMAEQAANQPPPPDPNMALVEVEKAKAEAQMMVEQFKAQTQQAIEREKLELERWKAQMQDDRERDKLARETALKEYALELEFQAKIEDAVLKAKIAADRAEMDAAVRREQIHVQAEVQRDAAVPTNAEGDE